MLVETDMSSVVVGFGADSEELFEGAGGDNVAAADTNDGDGKFSLSGEFVARGSADAEYLAGCYQVDGEGELLYLLMAPGSDAVSPVGSSRERTWAGRVTRDVIAA